MHLLELFCVIPYSFLNTAFPLLIFYLLLLQFLIALNVKRIDFTNRRELKGLIDSNWVNRVGSLVTSSESEYVLKTFFPLPAPIDING